LKFNCYYSYTVCWDYYPPPEHSRWTLVDPCHTYEISPCSRVAVAVITGVVYKAVKAITDPIISAILSFSTGGRVDQPTMAIIGDDSRLGGRNREWFFNDS
jgi:hypothetical protein